MKNDSVDLFELKSQLKVTPPLAQPSHGSALAGQTTAAAAATSGRVPVKRAHVMGLEFLVHPSSSSAQQQQPQGIDMLSDTAGEIVDQEEQEEQEEEEGVEGVPRVSKSKKRRAVHGLDLYSCQREHFRKPYYEYLNYLVETHAKYEYMSVFEEQDHDDIKDNLEKRERQFSKRWRLWLPDDVWRKFLGAKRTMSIRRTTNSEFVEFLLILEKRNGRRSRRNPNSSVYATVGDPAGQLSSSIGQQSSSNGQQQQQQQHHQQQIYSQQLHTVQPLGQGGIPLFTSSSSSSAAMHTPSGNEEYAGKKVSAGSSSASGPGSHSLFMSYGTPMLKVLIKKDSNNNRSPGQNESQFSTAITSLPLARTVQRQGTAAYTNYLSDLPRVQQVTLHSSTTSGPSAAASSHLASYSHPQNSLHRFYQ